MHLKVLSILKVIEAIMADKQLSCPVETTLNVIGGRWKVLILQQLFGRVKRFNELRRALVGITHKTLTQQLREMEMDGSSIVRSFRRFHPRSSIP